MFTYILRRVILFIPTLFIISLLTFVLSQYAPGDPVELKMVGGMGGQSNTIEAKLNTVNTYQQIARKLGLDLPSFYFSITASAYPDTLYKVPIKKERKNLSKLISRYGNWPQISDYYYSIKELEDASYDIARDSNSFKKIRAIRESCVELYDADDPNNIDVILAKIKEAGMRTTTVQIDSLTTEEVNATEPLMAAINGMIAKFEEVKNKQTRWKLITPAIYWYGARNQYHRWLFGDVPWFGENDDPTLTSYGFFRGDFGRSYLDDRPVGSIVWDSVKWTTRINLIVLFIIYALAIPIGVFSAINKGTKSDQVVSTTLFILYSLPSFWIATLLITFFTTDQYGMDFFPTHGVKSSDLPEDAGFFTVMIDQAYHFILPIFCMTYGSLAFLSRQMRGGVLDVIKQDYIRTARAKGLDESTVIWKHVFRNSLIPIITIFAGLLPFMISGSTIIEIIFAIPGMGKVSYESVVARNYPVLFTVLMFSAILTMIGVLLSDILYAIVDPRISFSKKS